MKFSPEENGTPQPAMEAFLAPSDKKNAPESGAAPTLPAESVPSPATEPLTPSQEAEYALNKWALRVIVTEKKQEEAFSSSMINLELQAQSAEAASEPAKTEETDSRQAQQEAARKESNALIRQKGDGAISGNRTQSVFARAYATYLDQRQDLLRDGIALTREHALPLSSLSKVLATVELPQPQIQAYEKDLLALSKAKATPATSHRYGGIFFLAPNAQDPTASDLYFMADRAAQVM